VGAAVSEMGTIGAGRREVGHMPLGSFFCSCADVSTWIVMEAHLDIGNSSTPSLSGSQAEPIPANENKKIHKKTSCFNRKMDFTIPVP